MMMVKEKEWSSQPTACGLGRAGQTENIQREKRFVKEISEFTFEQYDFVGPADFLREGRSWFK